MPQIKLNKLQCIVNDEIDEDEVFLKYNGEKIWPEGKWYRGIDSSETFELDVLLDHPDANQPLIIELWDFDYLSPNDFLGTFEMLIGKDTSGKFSTSMKLKEKKSTLPTFFTGKSYEAVTFFISGVFGLVWLIFMN